MKKPKEGLGTADTMEARIGVMVECPEDVHDAGAWQADLIIE